MNLQLLYWYILSLSKIKICFTKKKKKQKQNKTTKKRRKKKAVTVESVSQLIKITHAHNLHVKVLDFVPFTIRT